MNEVVLDASDLLAVSREEPGAERVTPRLDGSAVSAVNLSEVVAADRSWSRLDLGIPVEVIR